MYIKGRLATRWIGVLVPVYHITLLSNEKSALINFFVRSVAAEKKLYNYLYRLSTNNICVCLWVLCKEYHFKGSLSLISIPHPAQWGCERFYWEMCTFAVQGRSALWLHQHWIGSLEAGFAPQLIERLQSLSIAGDWLEGGSAAVCDGRRLFSSSFLVWQYNFWGSDKKL